MYNCPVYIINVTYTSKEINMGWNRVAIYKKEHHS